MNTGLIVQFGVSSKLLDAGRHFFFCYIEIITECFANEGNIARIILVYIKWRLVSMKTNVEKKTRFTWCFDS